MDRIAEVAKGLKAAKDNFETRRKIIETLNVRVTLQIKDEQKLAYVSLLGDIKQKTLPLSITVL